MKNLTVNKIATWTAITALTLAPNAAMAENLPGDFLFIKGFANAVMFSGLVFIPLLFLALLIYEIWS
ncbi:MAG: hypothetical protein ACYTGQ_02240 [Planctomycetota bacterium]